MPHAYRVSQNSGNLPPLGAGGPPLLVNSLEGAAAFDLYMITVDAVARPDVAARSPINDQSPCEVTPGG